MYSHDRFRSSLSAPGYPVDSQDAQTPSFGNTVGVGPNFLVTSRKLIIYEWNWVGNNPDTLGGPKTWNTGNTSIYNGIPIAAGPDPGYRAQNLRRHNDPPTPGLLLFGGVSLSFVLNVYIILKTPSLRFL